MMRGYTICLCYEAKAASGGMCRFIWASAFPFMHRPTVFFGDTRTLNSGYPWSCLPLQTRPWVYMGFCRAFDWFVSAPGTGLAANALDRFVCTVHGSQFSEDGRCGLPYRVSKRSRAPGQKRCCTVLEMGKSHN
jgi:hypothetical protein